MNKETRTILDGYQNHTDKKFEETKQYFDEKTDEAKRYFDEKTSETKQYIETVAEGLEKKIQTVAEQITINTSQIQEIHDKLEDHDQKFDQIYYLLLDVNEELSQKANYRELQTLEKRVGKLEPKLT